MKKLLSLVVGLSILLSTAVFGGVSAEDSDYYYQLAVKVKEKDGTVLVSPELNTSYLAEISVIETAQRDTADYFIVAIYGVSGKLLSMQYAYADLDTDEDKTTTFGFTIPKSDEYIAKVCAYAWDGLGTMTPLAASKTKQYNEIPTVYYDALEVCPPYETACYSAFTGDVTKYFTMGGVNYTNGFTFGYTVSGDAFALFNLNGEYSYMDLTIGHVDGSSVYDRTVYFYLDGVVTETLTISADALPISVSIPLNNASQLKIYAPVVYSVLGFANVTLRY